MSEMRERIARAIYESKLFQPARADDPWDGEPSATKIFCRLAAQDVLKAMRTPTRMMLDRGRDGIFDCAVHDGHGGVEAADPVAVWGNMIDAALNTPDKPPA